MNSIEGGVYMIYLDQAASSFPKPPAVAEAMVKAVNEYGANPGRSGHTLSRQGALVIEETRQKVAQMFQCDSAKRVVFSLNATSALNQAILGLSLKNGDHIITTCLEHNSVRRPIEKLVMEKGVSVSYIPPDNEGKYSLEQLEKEIKPTTKLVAVTHGSNVTGEIFPIAEWGNALKNQQAFFLVDASQTAGVLPIQMNDLGIDLLCFPGHKGLLGPQGVGVLLAGSQVELTPIMAGGTVIYSESPFQPEEWPFLLESGTLNTPGIAGLAEGINEVNKIGLDSIYKHELELTERTINGLNQILGIQWFGPQLGEPRLGVVSFSVEGIDPHEMALILDEHFNIAVRAGIHCAPLIHKYLKTDHTGLIRASFGIYNTVSEVDAFVDAVKEISAGLR